MYYLIIFSEIILILAILCFRTLKDSKSRLKAVIITGIIISLLTVVCLFVCNDITAAAILMFFGTFLALFELIRKISRDRLNRFIPHIVAALLALIFFSYSFYVSRHLVITRYEIGLGSDLRIAQISDTHIGNFFSTDDLKRSVDMINGSSPDVVVITGDLVDENTTPEEMKETCRVLGELRSTYGTFYVPGNHDAYWGLDKGVKDGYQALVSNLESNNVKVLGDRAYEIGDDYLLLGRLDQSFSKKTKKRTTMKEIMEKGGYLGTDRKVIVLDHRPVKLKRVSEDKDAGVDLMLSGDTHGGQMFPINVVCKITSGKDDILYGKTKIGDTYFIVSSGASSGVIPFKNMVPCEVVIIDLK